MIVFITALACIITISDWSTSGLALIQIAAILSIDIIAIVIVGHVLNIIDKLRIRTFSASAATA